MIADSRSSRLGVCQEYLICGYYSEKENQLSRLSSGIPPRRLLFSLLFLLTFLSAAAQTSNARPTVIHGLIVTAQEHPVSRATVEVWNLQGLKIATCLTDGAGNFAVTTMAAPGEYLVLAAKGLQITDERITLDQPDREVKIALSVASGSVVGTSREMYIVSARELRVPPKARAHLRLAQREFIRSNLAGAEKEVDQALLVDSTYAAAFSMRALLRLASTDFNAAIEDATRALALDPDKADACVALAAAYNSLGEFQKAEVATQRALEIYPDFWQGRLELAKAFYGEKRLVLALREVDELKKDFPDVHLVRANILM